ncbi:MAG TPA: sigma-54-dependent Fis family transcriptional regulator [bacterium]|nr:sigma-54-dependent Fis family transcriptional regulator [bacterium]
MTSALNGSVNATRARARVGLVSPQGADRLAAGVERAGHEVFACPDWAEMTAALAEQPADILFCHSSCIDEVPATCDVPVVRFDENADEDMFLRTSIALAVTLGDRTRRLAELERIVDGIRTGAALVGATPVMRRLQSAISRAADCDATVLIEGPVGSGKSLASRAIHLKSRRCQQPIVVHECDTLSADALAKEIECCSQTTLVLESIEKLSAAAQQVLVKHLKERSSSRAPSLARLIATTSAHIPELVARGAFREDLYYRLHAFPILVPGLHERVDDIAALCDAILDAGVPSSGRNHNGFTPAARMLLESMEWPGHVAQLEATVRRGQLMAGGAPIDREHLMAPASGPAPVGPASTTGNAAAEEVELTEESIRPFEEEEKFLLGRALQATKGNVRRAAQLLGIGRATLYRKIQQFDLRLH